jgi:hypothetical protein
MSSEARVQSAIDVTDLLMTGHHLVLRVGVHRDVVAPFAHWNSPELDPGTPVGGDVMLDGMRFCIGSDNANCLSYWVLKQSLQDHPLCFRTAGKEILLDEIDAFGFLRVLEDAQVAYSREIWRNSVCAVTILQSGVTIAFDLEPTGKVGFGAIQQGTTPLYYGGDVFRRTEYH